MGMTMYESIFMVRSTLKEDELSKVTEKIKQLVEKGGGKILNSQNWGKKKLAYEINKEKKATYLSFLLSGDKKLVQELNHFARVQEALIRLFIVKAGADALTKATAQPQPAVSTVETGKSGVKEKDQVKDQVKDQANEQVKDQANEQVKDQANEQVNDQANEQVNDQANEQVNDQANEGEGDGQLQ